MAHFKSIRNVFGGNKNLLYFFGTLLQQCVLLKSCVFLLFCVGVFYDLDNFRLQNMLVYMRSV